MDRTLKNESGFTLIELVIVLVIVGVLVSLTVVQYDRLQSVNSINDDMHRISAYFQSQKMLAFTQKQNVQITVAGNQLTSIIDPGGVATAGLGLTLENQLISNGSPFTINPRGLVNVAGNISVNAVNTGAQFSCVSINRIRIRLGGWDGANCNAL